MVWSRAWVCVGCRRMAGRRECVGAGAPALPAWRVHRVGGMGDRPLPLPLPLPRRIYNKTAAYGHFGRNDKDFTWETPKALTGV